MCLLEHPAEWLETNGRGGFASGTTAGVRTRQYHALLNVATTPPTGRVILVNGLDVWIDTASASYPLSTQCYHSDVIQPDGHAYITTFSNEPWPQWTYTFPDGTEVRQEFFVPYDADAIACRWSLVSPETQCTLRVYPLLSGRDQHALHQENADFQFDPQTKGDAITWQPYPGAMPAVTALTNATYTHQPQWFKHFHYAEEAMRGLPAAEDLANPGQLDWDLTENDAVVLFSTSEWQPPAGSALQVADELSAQERTRREQFPGRLQRAADAYIVQRGSGRTIIAGYPWFTDWGRDTFIALRGLCLATGRLEDARQILTAWAGTVSEGMLPNRFIDQGDEPEFNSVDAPLWFIIAVHAFLQAAHERSFELSDYDQHLLLQAVTAILEGYSHGTRYGIHLDDDGLIAAGEPGVQLTWMDAKVGDWVVTPRIGKPVEIQALWLNALWLTGQIDAQWLTAFERGQHSFHERFWHESDYLYDVVDADHTPGTADDSLRPNQILAVGGLPICLLDQPQASAVVDTVEAHLLTPLGLRSLTPQADYYVPHYEGDVWQRDGAYHQGTVWPWLLGPFVEAWVRVRGNTITAKQEARKRFLAPLLDHVQAAGLGHISEIADGDPPHTPRGCPFQAWSVAEALRLDLDVLAEQ